MPKVDKCTFDMEEFLNETLILPNAKEPFSVINPMKETSRMFSPELCNVKVTFSKRQLLQIIFITVLESCLLFAVMFSNLFVNRP